MSTDSPTASASSLEFADTSPVPFLRLAWVEARKAVDTRAGRWLIVTILGLVFAVQRIYALAVTDDSLEDFEEFLGLAGGVLGYFLPILIIMLVTSEQSQRNGLVTFTLEPRRPRIVAAKLVAGVLLSVVVLVLAAAFAVLGTMLRSATGGTPEWSVDANLLFNGFVLGNLVGVLVGFALATLIMNTAAAIVAYFAYTLILPIAVGILSSLNDTFEDIAPWIDFNTAQLPLFSGDYQPNGEEWAQIAVTGTIWLVIPLVLGIWRLLRIEFK